MSMTVLELSVRLSAMAAALLLSGASFNPGNDFPSADDCSDPEAISLTSLSIVKLDSTATFDDYEVVPLVLGGQGGEMVMYRIAVESATIPKCVDFEIQFARCLTMDCAQIDDDTRFPRSQRLVVYDEELGGITKSHFHQLNYGFNRGTLARLRVSAGGAEATALLWLEATGDFVDAGFEDAGQNTDAQMAR